MTPAEFHQHRLQQLGQMLQRVPAGVISGSIQKVTKFKDWATKAQRLIAKGRKADLEAINNLIGEYSEFK